MTASTPSETAARKNLAKLQRAIVDGLQDVKAQDIQVFDTEHLSPLFERVIVASGSSNRQTKALAASVRDAVREAGFAKPRTEGEDNGEWVIVDCGAAVAHIMQPAIRQYYRLEDLWGDKPVRIQRGAAKPFSPSSGGVAAQAADQKPARKAAAKAPARKIVARTAAKPVTPSAAKPATKAPARPAGKAAGKTTAARKTAIETIVIKPSGANKPAAKAGAKARPARKKAAARKG
ncbi:ribosome silencing factor [Verminephrobacter eiseniae]|uniref:ribosome silencing factor n=1 Tax=Verminephrobacter eiseniae TaxID=364317 RepID=UPI00223753F6|nr:ribosome silencing factor [Verminephrobacter eiseniae]MCW5238484.1 ribosome silencing factor [Verminephrobacter eiseniae]